MSKIQKERKRYFKLIVIKAVSMIIIVIIPNRTATAYFKLTLKFLMKTFP